MSDPQAYFGGGAFDGDDFGDPSVGIAIDTDDGPSFGGHRSTSTTAFRTPTVNELDIDDDDSRVVGAKPSPRAQASTETSRREWPTGASPDASSLRIDPVEVAVVADYGEAPSHFVQAIAYVLRVSRRKRLLTALVKERHEAFSAAEYERDCLVVAMVRDLRGKILLTNDGERHFEPIVELERLGLERRAVLAGKSAEYDRRSRELDEHRAALERGIETPEDTWSISVQRFWPNSAVCSKEPKRRRNVSTSKCGASSTRLGRTRAVRAPIELLASVNSRRRSRPTSLQARGTNAGC